MKKPTLKQLLLAKHGREQEIKRIRLLMNKTPFADKIRKLRREIYDLNKKIEENL